MQNNISEIIANALSVTKDALTKNIPQIIDKIKNAIDINRDLIVQANQIDQKNNNGFIIDFNVIENIFSNVEKDNLIYGQVILSQKDSEKNPIKVDDTVEKITKDGRIGKVLTVGELIEVEWQPDLITLEYPEELIHTDNPEEDDGELVSLETDPPVEIEEPNS
mgnify:CR=1 FL=1